MAGRGSTRETKSDAARASTARAREPAEGSRPAPELESPSVRAQATLLDGAPWQTAQRRSLAAEVAALHGNRALQRLVGALRRRRGTTTRPAGPQPGAGRGSRVPPLLTAPRPGGIRRKILIAGRTYVPVRDYNWMRAKYGAAAVEFLASMHNDRNPPVYRFKDYAQMHHEVRVRTNLIKAMGETAGGCCTYPHSRPGGYLDNTYWDRRGPYHFVVKTPLPAGKGASDAIEAIFQTGAGTQLDCNAMMAAVQYYGILKSIGPQRFNRRFPGGRGVVIKPTLISGAVDQPNAMQTQRLYKRVSITGFADLLPGDWVYFLNVRDYQTKHPGGFWSGEHALYVGNDKFSGFGAQQLSNDAMLQKLLDAYNRGLPTAQHKQLTDVPGIVPQVIRRPVVRSYTR